MENARCLISETYDPWFNLATEDWIFRDMDPSEHVLFLWRNDKTVVIGRNQNPWSECNLEKMKKGNVNLVRRQSGGGAVFQDLGNTCFTFLCPRERYDKKRNFQIIINALGKLGINAEASGRNDILVDGKKVSGSAFKENSDRAFHHGTLMINVNLDELANYLTPSKKKLVSKGTASVRSRVANLSEFGKEISHELLAKELISEFFRTYGSEENVRILDEGDLKKIPALNEYYNFLRSRDWILGESPRFEHHLEERFDWGTLDLHLNSENGRIVGVKIFSDCLNPELVDALEKAVEGADYDPDSIRSRTSLIKENRPELTGQIDDFNNWISREIPGPEQF